jgi:cell volume regulation protein A
MMFSVEGFLLLVSATLFLSYISSLFYTKTRIPDIVWLLCFGYLLGPVLHFFDKEIFITIFPMLILVTVSIFSFDTGINVDVSGMMNAVIKVLILAFATFLAITGGIGFVLNFFMPELFTLEEGMLLGAMVGGLGGISVTGILNRLKTLIPAMEKDGVILNLESTLSDPIRIVACFTLINMITSEVTLQVGIKDIVFVFTISAVLGIVYGLMWSEVLHLLSNRPFNYMMTIAALFPVYIASERYVGQGGGAITALAFGLAITNHDRISKFFGSKRKVKVNKTRIREFNQEITFLIKAFFFVYLGLIVSISVNYALIGLGVVLLMLVIRYVTATGVAFALRFTDGERILSRLIYLQGASALVLSRWPILYDPEHLFFRNPNIYTDLCYPIVLFTIVLVSIMGPVLARRQMLRASIRTPPVKEKRLA